MVPEVWRLRQKDHDFKARLGYTVSFCPERHGGRKDRQRNTSKGDQAALDKEVGTESGCNSSCRWKSQAAKDTKGEKVLLGTGGEC